MTAYSAGLTAAAMNIGGIGTAYATMGDSGLSYLFENYVSQGITITGSLVITFTDGSAWSYNYATGVFTDN